MREFIAQFCKERNGDRINLDMFQRAYDKPLHEYIVDACKNLEVIPAIKLESWELITDQTKIRGSIDKKHSKDPKIKNNRTLERLAQPNRTLYDMLVLHFRVTARGRSVVVTRKVRILKPIKNGLYIRNGKKVRILNQVVDNSTFVKSNVLNFKTKLYPIRLSTVRCKLKFLDGESVTAPCFRLNLLFKVTNPLIYYLAQYGLVGTLEMFNLENVISVVDTPLDESHYMYLPIANDVYLEVHEKAFYAHEFVGTFVATLYDLLKEDKAVTFRDVYTENYWLGRLSEIFSKKRYANKALRVLMSFNKIMDISVKKQLILGKRHKKNTFTIIRWMMVNFNDLIKKDSNDLKHKRVRANEVLAYFFEKHISKNVYSLLNTDNPPFDKYLRLLNSIGEFTLLRGAHGGDKSSPTSMYRYERYNDFDALEIARYTLKGPTGLNGGKKGLSMHYRNIYPSQYGRYELNFCSSSDPGLTGYLCANVQLDESGYFDPTGSGEPDNYDPAIDAILERFADPEYAKKREDYVKLQLSRDPEGFMQLKRKMNPEETQDAFLENPEAYGLYRTNDGLRLIPRMENVDTKGFKVLVHRRTPKEEAKMIRDPDGFMLLKPVITKMDRLKAGKKK